jgi:hypothetical protein
MEPVGAGSEVMSETTDLPQPKAKAFWNHPSGDTHHARSAEFTFEYL